MMNGRLVFKFGIANFPTVGFDGYLATCDGIVQEGPFLI